MNSPFLQTYTENITVLLQCGSICISDPDQLSEFILRLMKEASDGVQGVQSVQSCNHTMSFSPFLKQWNPPQYRKYVREKEMAKKNYQPKFAG